MHQVFEVRRSQNDSKASTKAYLVAHNNSTGNDIIDDKIDIIDDKIEPGPEYGRLLIKTDRREVFSRDSYGNFVRPSVRLLLLFSLLAPSTSSSFFISPLFLLLTRRLDFHRH